MSMFELIRLLVLRTYVPQGPKGPNLGPPCLQHISRKLRDGPSYMCIHTHTINDVYVQLPPEVAEQLNVQIHLRTQNYLSQELHRPAQLKISKALVETSF